MLVRTQSTGPPLMIHTAWKTIPERRMWKLLWSVAACTVDLIAEASGFGNQNRGGA